MAKEPQKTLPLGLYEIKKGWIDAYGRTRNWKLVSREGKHIATVMFRCEAVKLIDLLEQKEASHE